MSFKRPLTFLPETIHSPFNRIVFNQILEKYLSKTESVLKTRILSNDVNIKDIEGSGIPISNSAFPIQPIIEYQLQGKTHHALFQDIITLAKRYGINIDTFDIWGRADCHNMVLPIDYDKFLNYSDYVWIGKNEQSVPHYITIKNSLIQDYIDIISNASLDTLFPNVKTVDEDQPIVGQRTFIVQGQYDTNYDNGIYTINTIDIEGNTYTLLASPSYNSVTNETSFVVAMADMVQVGDVVSIPELYDIFKYGFSTSFSINYVDTSSLNQWQINNQWVHKSLVPSNFSGPRASIPIIEFSDLLELNTHSEIIHGWAYRASKEEQWQDVDVGPSSQEILIGTQELTNNEQYSYATVNYPLKRVYVGTTDLFNVGDYISINGVSRVWQISNEGFDTMFYIDVNDPLFNVYRFDASSKLIHKCVSLYDVVDVTIGATNTITVKGNASSIYTIGQNIRILPFFGEGVGTLTQITNVLVSGGDTILTVDRPGTYGRITSMTETSKSDPWAGFATHWLYRGVQNVVPTNTPTTLITTFTKVVNVNIGDTIDIITTNGSDLFVSSPYAVKLFIDGILETNYEYGVYETLPTPSFTPVYDDYTYQCNAVRLNTPLVAERPHVITFVYGPITTDNNDDDFKSCYVRVDEQGTIKPAYLCSKLTTSQQCEELFTQPLFNLYDVSGTDVVGVTTILEFNTTTQNNLKYVSEIDHDVDHDSYDNLLFVLDELVNNSNRMFKLNNVKTNLWQADGNYFTYVPKLVDKDGIAQPGLTTETGVWEIPPYLFGNTVKEGTSYVSQRDLITHLTNTIAAKNVISNICVWNIPFDRLITMILSKTLFKNVIEFQQRQHMDYIYDVVNIVQNNLFDILSLDYDFDDLDPLTLTLNDYVTAVVKENLKEDDRRNLFVDAITGINNDLFNICPTACFMGMVDRKAPIILNKTDGVIVKDHMGCVIEAGNFFNIESVQQFVRRYRIPTNVTAPVNGSLRYASSTLQRYYGGTWENVNINDVYANVLYALEQELYIKTASINNNLVSLNPILEALPFYEDVLKTQFLNYCLKKSDKLSNINIFFDKTNAFTWNYNSVNPTQVLDPRNPLSYLTSTDWGVSYKTIYKKLYGTHVPNLEPWKLQGYYDKPTWWDSNYAGIGRRWTTTMWSNIKQGIVPVGELLPSLVVSTGAVGEVQTYDRVCVNTTNTTSSDGVQPDQLLPPYWSSVVVADAAIVQEALIDNFSLVDYNMINALYEYGDGSEIEFEWRQSIEFVYDELLAHFASSPIDFCKMQDQYNTVVSGGLHYRDNNLSSLFNDVMEPSIVNNSIAMLYFLYGRYNNIQGNIYTTMWNMWLKYLSMPMSGIIDNAEISSDNDRLTNNDIRTIVVESDIDDSLTFTNLLVRIGSLGNLTRTQALRYGSNLYDWEFVVDSPMPLSQSIVVNRSLFTRVIDVDFATHTFTINDPSLQNRLVSGLPIVFSADGSLGSDFEDQDVFYVITTTDAQKFLIARTVNDAINGINIELEDVGQYVNLYVGVPSKTYDILNGSINSDVWYQYATSDDTQTLTTPFKVTGLINLLNILDGYKEHLKRKGINEYNYSYPNIDDVLNREQNWQYEKELLVASIFKTIKDRSLTQDTIFEFTPFKTDVWLTGNGFVAPLNDTLEKDDISYIYDVQGQIIPSNELVVFRDDDTRIQTTNRGIGGGTVLCTSIQHVIIFNTHEYTYQPFVNWFYSPYKITFDELANVTTITNNKINGRVDINGSLVNNFEDLTINQTLCFTNNANQQTIQQMFDMMGFNRQSTVLNEQSEYRRWSESLKSRGSNEHLITALTSANTTVATVDEFWAIKETNVGCERLVETYNSNFDETNIAWLPDAAIDLRKIITTDNGVDNVILGTFAPISVFTTDIMYPTYKAVIELKNSKTLYKYTYIKNTGTFSQTIICDYLNVADFVNVVVDGVKRTDFTIMYLPTGITVNIPFTTEEQLTGHVVYISLQNTIELDVLLKSIDKIEVSLPAQYNINNGINKTLYGIVPNYASVNIGASRDQRLTFAKDVMPYDPQQGLYGLQKDEYNFFQYNDPAQYNVVENVQTVNLQTSSTDLIDTIWIVPCDTWAPYEIDSLYSTTAEQILAIGHYGNLADASVYEWVQTDIPPDVWHSLNMDRENTTIKDNANTSQYIGEPLHKIQKRTRAVNTDPWSAWTNVVDQTINSYYAPGSYTIDVSSIASPNDILFVCINNVWTTIVQVNNSSEVSVTVTSTPLDENKVTLIKRAALLDNTELVEYRYAYNYTTISPKGLPQQFYYWVKGTNKSAKLQQIIEDPINDRFVSVYRNNKFNYGILNREYNTNTEVKCVITTKNVSMYDKPHSVWKLYSETTGSRISSELWQHLIDSAKGVDVPSSSLVAYDMANGTNTRYGMGTGQTMLDSEDITQIALDVILNSGDITTYTRDQIVDMLTTDVGNALTDFYDTLPIYVINTLFLTVVKSMLSLNNSDSILKTSMLSIESEIQIS